MNSTTSQECIGHPLAIVTQRLFENEPATRQQEIASEIVTFYENGRDDIFFSIADQVLTKAITNNLENYLKQLVALAEERSVDEFSFELKIVRPIVVDAHRILSSLEDLYSADLTYVGRILSTPDYRESVAKLIREKIDRYLELFKGRNVDVVDVYGNTGQCGTGAAYEEYVGSAFEKAGWNTSKTPVTGDQGADLICIKSGLKLVVQCKFYSGNVGNTAVQEVHAARGFYDANHAVVISNAGFTRSAIELAGKLGILLVTDDKLEQFVRGQIT